MKEKIDNLLRTAHILCLDCVGFSKLHNKMDDQIAIRKTLDELIHSCSLVSSQERVRDYLYIDTGDGSILAFLNSPESPLLTALELAGKLKKASIPCRMGLHIGPVYLREDMNEQRNLTGGGVNLAQRIMDFGDAGHILASKEIMNSLSQVKREYESLFHELGPYMAKHDVIIELYNVYNDDVGNANPPSRGRTKKEGIDSVPWNIPYSRNPFFTGREDILADLHSALKSSHATALSQPQAIYGLGGIGKTQTAIEYAYRHWDEYTALLWVPSYSPEAIIDGFVALAGILNLPEKDEKDQNLAVSAVMRWLEGHTHWLLIFDNADNPDLIEAFIPRHAQGHIILTSRAQVFDILGITDALEVKKMEPTEARRFLMERTNHSHLDGDDAKALGELIMEFDGLPLALEQAGAYILKMKCTFRDYLSAYKTRGLILLKQMTPVVGKYPQSVATTWLLNFQEVETISPASADLLRTSAFLSPDRIPFEVFISGAKELGPAISDALINAKDDPLILNEVLAPLTQFSLIHIDRQSRTYDVHRLVQAVLKDSMDEPTRRMWSERTVQAINTSFPSVEFSNWPTCERLIGQALACADLIDRENFVFEGAAYLLNQAACYLYERAQYTREELLLKRALKIREKVLGPDHPDVAISLYNLAVLYNDQGKYQDAEPLFKRALEIEKALGPSCPKMATSLNSLALLYRNQGKYQAAEPLFKRALVISEKAFGRDHPNVATSLNNLGKIYKNQGKYQDAEPLIKGALEIREKILGPCHPSVAMSLYNLASLYKSQEKYQDAEPLFKRALEIMEKALGPDHPDVTTIREDLENLRKKM